ncbi:DNA-methyltransferase [Agromyces humi]|uniref:DNA-methyltransferase n=1 Tax=Agromyces humi TaxID=1766800 RepID=UPI00135C81DE|nr:site-specific DNA-methyltransferase [Agromyces humi]
MPHPAPAIHRSDDAITIWNGDSRDVLRQLEDNSVDHIVCDPPYEIDFTRQQRGVSWDRTGIAFDVEFWSDALRVLKPGGNLVAAGAARTYHRLAVAVEDAGFEIRDSIVWCYGQGMSLGSADVAHELRKAGHGDIADEYQGCETRLKPAYEPWVVARKPLEGTVVENVLEWGTGFMNIDAVRIPTDEDRSRRNGDTDASTWKVERATERTESHAGGRWPTNMILSHAEACGEDGPCIDDCPVQMIKAQGKKSDSSRYFPILRYESKARGAERPQKGSRDEHSTMKPIALMRWLVQLAAMPGQTVLDPFLGSGTTAEACIDSGVDIIGIELEAKNMPAIDERIDRALARKLEAAA